MKPLFENPLGPSEGISFPGIWKDGTTRAVTCQICGTRHPGRNENDDSYWLGRFLGRQVVAECCGRIYNFAYGEIGEVFAVEKLDEVAKDPTGNAYLIGHVSNCMTKARKRLEETGFMVEQVICDVGAIVK